MSYEYVFSTTLRDSMELYLNDLILNRYLDIDQVEEAFFERYKTDKDLAQCVWVESLNTTPEFNV